MLIARASIAAALMLSLASCEVHVNSDVEATSRRIRFTVHGPDGSSRQAEKFYNTGLNPSGPASRAYDAAQMGQSGRALQIMESEVFANPGHAWSHYDLGILYEVAGRWADAHREAREACRLDRPRGGRCNGRFRREIHFTETFLPR